MIVYSVSVSIEDEIQEDWLKWMKEIHIPDVMATGYFQNYRLLKVISHQPDEIGTTFNIQYDCESMKDLHQYQVKHAPSLQKEHNARFEGKFAAFRTLLEKV